MALAARIESRCVALAAAFHFVLLALGRVLVKESWGLVVGREKIELGNVAGSALRHGVAFRLMTDQAVRHQRVVLTAAQIRLPQSPVTRGADFGRLYLLTNGRRITLGVTAGFERCNQTRGQVRNAQVLLVAEKHGPRRDLRPEIRRLASHVTFFLQVAERADFRFRNIHVFARAALRSGRVALDTGEPDRLEVHGMRETRA